jgi:hypothetical protein
MKNLLLLAVMAAALYAGYTQWKAGEAEAGAPTRFDGYKEVRAVFGSPAREFEMVWIFDRPITQDCAELSIPVIQADICPGLPGCRIIRAECTATLPARYRSMLAQSPGSTRYAHRRIEAKAADGGGTHDSIAVLWGATDEESAMFCELARRSRKPYESITCH